MIFFFLPISNILRVDSVFLYRRLFLCPLQIGSLRFFPSSVLVDLFFGDSQIPFFPSPHLCPMLAEYVDLVEMAASFPWRRPPEIEHPGFRQDRQC